MSYSPPPYPGSQPPADPPGGQWNNPSSSNQWSPPGGGQPVPSQRPGGVTAAAVITIILSAITTLLGIAFVATSGPIANLVRDNPELLEGVSTTDRQDILEFIDAALIGVGIFTLIIGVIGIVLGVLVLKPRPWARILLTIGAGLTAVVGLFMTLNIVGLPWLAGSIAVIVLLYVGKASDWFAGRPPCT